ncbi:MULTISPECIES: hypothetical protein [Proteiniphilum]|jgi:hypothetical protein|uniref:hypothetical protein n=1 Tax=Proteiniphilum TaxID=294702 RepID=UPI001EEAA5D7|nr:MULTISPECIES: hypothetical protein [Proteiniphilum]ULB35211.1 hypothetical protein KDN43_03995 [Proteiniphilum propionicum]
MYQYKSEALIYIEPSFDDNANKAIVENYQFIVDSFKQIGISFIYLPKLLTNDSFNKVMDYNHPYFNNYDQADLAKLYPQLINHFKIISDEPVLAYFSDEADEVYKFEFHPCGCGTAKEQLTVNIKEILNEINQIKAEIQLREDQEPHLEFRILDYSVEYKKEKDADSHFERVAFEIPEDLRKKINELKEAGYLSKLIEFLEELQKTTRKLSRLHITKDFKIYLMDYEMKEVKMSPLPKALYFLFLNHPEGILFKELTDYRTELMTIYKNISLRENPDEARESIKKMTDPFDNSVNEKCSRIRTAFLRVVAEDIAENYYITGYRGEEKKILLDRELVIYEKDSILQGL